MAAAELRVAVIVKIHGLKTPQSRNDTDAMRLRPLEHVQEVPQESMACTPTLKEKRHHCLSTFA